MSQTKATENSTPPKSESNPLDWIEEVLPGIMRRLMDSENLDMPLFQLPLAQMRLAQMLFREGSDEGETMGRLSERLGVKQNALTQAADRLVNHGLAERLSDPTDRRIVRLRLTQKGQEWVQERRTRRHFHLQNLWNHLDEAEQKAFITAIETLKNTTDRIGAIDSSHNETSNGTRKTADQTTVEELLTRLGTDS